MEFKCLCMKYELANILEMHVITIYDDPSADDIVVNCSEYLSNI